LRKTVWYTAEECCGSRGQVHARGGDCNSRGLCVSKQRIR
jgi:hypothetical protein